MKKVKIEIKNRWTGNVLFEYEKEDNTLKETVQEAIRQGADLGGAYLGGADLEGAYLRGAYLRGADLRGAYLRGANLEGAYLEGANLEGAYLEGAYLRGAYLYVSDNEIDQEEIINAFEKETGLKLTETYINHDIIPTRWSCFWRNGLIIREYEVAPKEVKEMTVAEISEALGYEVKVVK